MRVWVVLLLVLLPAWPVLAGEPLVMVYPHRPPYFYTEQGQAAGTLVELVRDILTDAGIAFIFAERPSKRILAELQSEDSRSCAFGWFRNPEREAYARFTLPIVQDTPLLAMLLRQNLARFAGKTAFRDLVEIPSLELGLVAGWSYGDYVDRVINQARMQPVQIPARQHLAPMLAHGRFTYTLVRAVEVEEIIRLSGRPLEDFTVMPLSDLQECNKRYILCGRGVPEDVLARINASIPKFSNVRD